LPELGDAAGDGVDRLLLFGGGPARGLVRGRSVLRADVLLRVGLGLGGEIFLLLGLGVGIGRLKLALLLGGNDARGLGLFLLRFGGGLGGFRSLLRLGGLTCRGFDLLLQSGDTAVERVHLLLLFGGGAARGLVGSLRGRGGVLPRGCGGFGLGGAVGGLLRHFSLRG
jgi:hypothetical protein